MAERSAVSPTEVLNGRQLHLTLQPAGTTFGVNEACVDLTLEKFGPTQTTKLNGSPGCSANETLKKTMGIAIRKVLQRLV